MFLITAIGGALAIIYLNRFNSKVAMFYPTIAVVIFAFFVMVTHKPSTDIEISEYYSESIYFLGFLFTLISLAALFYRLGNDGLGSILGPGTEAVVEQGSEAAVVEEPISKTLKASEVMALSMQTIEKTFEYIGIAVTTSIAGVLMRNVVKARFIKNYVPESSDVEQSYGLLKEISTTLNSGFMDSVGAIGSYLEERKDLAGTIQKKEEEYIKSLESFNRSINEFTRNMDTSGANLSSSSSLMTGHLEKQITTITKTDAGLMGLMYKLEEIQKSLADLKINNVAESMGNLNTRTNEFNEVLDKLIEIVEKKVDLVRRGR